MKKKMKTKVFIHSGSMHKFSFTHKPVILSVIQLYSTYSSMKA